MIPKKASKLYVQVSEELGVNTTLVEDLVECFYKEVRQNLSNLKHPRLNVEGLGHFAVKPGTVRKVIPRYHKSLEDHDTSTFGAYYNKKMIEGKLEALIDIEKKISLQEEKKNNFKQKKYEDQSKGNLEEPQTDH